MKTTVIDIETLGEQGAFDVKVDGRAYKVTVEHTGTKKEVSEVEAKDVTAPMPGMIISYEVKVGDEVKVNEVVVLLEAMKMTNAISSPVSGRVKAIKFKAGDKVARDDVLAIIGW